MKFGISLNFHYFCTIIQKKMKKHILLGILTLLALPLMAQDEYCSNYDDYVAGKWKEIAGTVTLKSARDNHLAYMLYSDDKQLQKALRKTAFCLRHEGTLYLNLRNSKYFHESFVNAYELPGGKLLFARPDVTRTPGGLYWNCGNFSVPISVRGFRSNSKLKNLVCYIVQEAGAPGSDEARKSITFFKVNEEVMKKLLSGHDALWGEYMDLDFIRRDNADVVIDFLKRAGKIER